MSNTQLTLFPQMQLSLKTSSTSAIIISELPQRTKKAEPHRKRESMNAGVI